MQVKTHVKAGTGGTGGGSNLNHNQAMVRPAGLPQLALAGPAR